VAIKILPEEFSRDYDSLSRFFSEAELLASLNYSNIAGIHDLQEANGSRYLVLELVEEQTLAYRLKREPIPLDEAVPIAKQIVRMSTSWRPTATRCWSRVIQATGPGVTGAGAVTGAVISAGFFGGFPALPEPAL